MLENLPTDPSAWVHAFEEMNTFSKAAFWVCVIAVAFKIGGEDFARVIRALLCRKD